MSVAVLIAFLAVIVGPLVTYFIAARRLSGKISNSEAADLWEESRSIRQDLIKRNQELNDVIRNCEKKILLLEERIDSLEIHNEALHKENGELKKENEVLRKENSGLRDRIKELELRVKELEDNDNGRL